MTDRARLGPALLGYSAAQIRAAERPLLDAGAPLMARAAAGLAAELRTLLAARASGRPARLVLLVGSGDNGGDALYAGAELAAGGAEVMAIPTGSRAHPGGAEAARAAGVRFLDEAAVDASLDALIAEADALLDGILGIGAARSAALRGRAREIVTRIRPLLEREPRPLVVAVDLPSGVDPDDGAVPDAAVLPADLTVVFGALKAGLLVGPAAEVAGEVALVDVGIGPELQGVDPIVRIAAGSAPHVRVGGLRRVRVVVRGRVQGVGFRVATQREAERRGLAGWVRNRPSGTVECEAEGPAAAVEELVDWLGRGPVASRVEGVDVAEAALSGEAGFRIRD